LDPWPGARAEQSPLGQEEHPRLNTLVIDGEPVETTPEHSFYVSGSGWTEAGDHLIGDQIASLAGGSGTVEAVETRTSAAVRYDLTVADVHTFFVGTGGWWVHNCAAGGGTRIVASNGTEITGFTRHGVNRAIGDGASRAGVKPEAVLGALKNPGKIIEGIDDLGRPFQVFHGSNARVVVNPQTGQIVSMNPLAGAGAH
jgi:hypothetical protein